MNVKMAIKNEVVFSCFVCGFEWQRRVGDLDQQIDEEELLRHHLRRSASCPVVRSQQASVKEEV